MGELNAAMHTLGRRFAHALADKDVPALNDLLASGDTTTLEMRDAWF